MNAPLSPAIVLEAFRREESKRACEKSLHEFVRQAWHVVEAGRPFVDGWFVGVICEHLEAVSSGEIRRLLINIPPRHTKSTIVSVMLNAWEWGPAGKPEEQYLCASYSSILSTRDNLKVRRLLQSQWYRDRWGDVFNLTGDQNQKTRFENDKTGYRIAGSVGGTTTGEGGTRLIDDDPLAAMEAQSDAIRDSTNEWIGQAWSTRLNDPKTSAMIRIMQRLHESDPSGLALREGGWEHVCLPAEYDGIKRTTSLGQYDPRTIEGSLLCPERFGPKELATLKRSLGEYGTSGQLQQKPSPAGGGILKVRDHIQIWPHDEPLPMLEFVVQSYDTAFTENTQGCPTAHSAWGVFQFQKKRCIVLLDAWAEHLGYPELRRRTLRDWNSTYGGSKGDVLRKPRKADVVLIEQKGSGQSLIQDLHAAKVPVAVYPPKGQAQIDKIARAHQAAPVLEIDIIYVIETSKPYTEHDLQLDWRNQFVAWSREFLQQCERFPATEYKDYVDTFTQAMLYLRDAGQFELDEAEPDDDVGEKDYSIRRQARLNPYAQ